MGDFFVNSMERLVAVIVVFALLLVLTSIAVMFSAQGGFLQGLLMLVLGSLYMVLMFGMVHVVLAIRANTRRTAIATEALLARQG
ncbi:hypothetical protein ACEYYA_05350 [Paracoccus sp. p3-h83]|uniref:hypothetical protein n=1 Tax=Paracoccus sp. p3-h83 TaxID=3342805 RepID=UPI0035B9D60F